MYGLGWGYAVFLASIIAWLIVWLPAVVFLFRAWRARRDLLFDYFDDEDENLPEDDFRGRAIAGYNELRALTADPPLPASESHVPQLSFRLARQIQDLDLRQTLLTARSEAERLRQLAEFMPAFLIRQRRVERVKQVAPRNGHGGKLSGIQ